MFFTISILLFLFLLGGWFRRGRWRGWRWRGWGWWIWGRRRRWGWWSAGFFSLRFCLLVAFLWASTSVSSCLFMNMYCLELFNCFFSRKYLKSIYWFFGFLTKSSLTRFLFTRVVTIIDYGRLFWVWKTVRWSLSGNISAILKVELTFICILLLVIFSLFRCPWVIVLLLFGDLLSLLSLIIDFLIWIRIKFILDLFGLLILLTILKLNFFLHFFLDKF